MAKSKGASLAPFSLRLPRAVKLHSGTFGATGGGCGQRPLLAAGTRFSPRPAYPAGMPAPSKRKAEKLRAWRVSLLRARAHYLGDVQVPDEKSAEAAAVAEFKLDQEQRKRLVVRERD
jgi:hypothetical protein